MDMPSAESQIMAVVRGYKGEAVISDMVCIEFPSMHHAASFVYMLREDLRAQVRITEKGETDFTSPLEIRFPLEGDPFGNDALLRKVPGK